MFSIPNESPSYVIKFNSALKRAQEAEAAFLLNQIGEQAKKIRPDHNATPIEKFEFHKSRNIFFLNYAIILAKKNQLENSIELIKNISDNFTPSDISESFKTIACNLNVKLLERLALAVRDIFAPLKGRVYEADHYLQHTLACISDLAFKQEEHLIAKKVFDLMSPGTEQARCRKQFADHDRAILERINSAYMED